MPDSIKEAFDRVKQDIDYLYNQLDEIKFLLEDLRYQQTNKQSISPTQEHLIPTHNANIPTYPTHIPTLQHSKTTLLSPNNTISTGNEGVPTNQPTNQPTIQHTPISTPTHIKSSVNDQISNLRRVSEILSTLDDLKKEVRIKFKKLTEQEMLIYESIYQLEEQGFMVDYALIAQKTSLSEISIRDYVRKIIQKQIPLMKSKEQNKKIILSIPSDLKKIASINTIHQLRSL